MREHIVRPGDSPAQIAIEYAGCPKCAADLIRANPHKPAVAMPNGFVTFRSLTPGERINLPDKWFDGSLDRRPRAYFAALPYADGATPSTLGETAAGVLADFATLDAAGAKVGALAVMNDSQFSGSVSDTANTIDASVQEVSGSGAPAIYASTYVQDVKKSTAAARQKNTTLASAIQSGDQSTGFQARTSILQDLSNALLSAQLALQAFYGDEQAPGDGGFLYAIKEAAQAAAAAIAADPNYCTSVAQVGSAVNQAVHAFKVAWNASQDPEVPINTGNYEQQTADVLAKVLGTAPAACHASSPTVVSPPQPQPAPAQSGLSVAGIFGIGLLAASAVGGAVYLAAQQRKHLP